MLGRLVIDDVRPRATRDSWAAKATIGSLIAVRAAIMRDGHDLLAARAILTRVDDADRSVCVPLQALGNDEWQGELKPEAIGMHQLTVEAWADHFATWRKDLRARIDAGDDIDVELLVGADLIERLVPHLPPTSTPNVQARLKEAVATLRQRSCSVSARAAAGLDDDVAACLEGVADPWDRATSHPVPVWVDRGRAGFSAWYEMFPRSEGGLEAARRRLGPIAEMGFDIVYLPPIHPIGTTHRKGRGNSLVAGPDDPGSPWAIGGPDGGHDAVHPDLGTIEDFDRFVADATGHGLEVALDYALQCSPDHPWVSEHPEWFTQRPDGSIRFAENPPKKYQDIFPLNFWPVTPDGSPDEAARVELWEACKHIIDHWVSHGVNVFRVDNPHTKPLAFWEWLIPAVHAASPQVIFLAEAFTTPKVMAKLAEVGFTQSYTYFTWRHTAQELRTYLEELAHGPTADYLRPNFWPTTPDILGGVLRDGPRAAFEMRAVLAALLVPNWGIYGGYELCENRPASDHDEEHLDSEKYELRSRDWQSRDSIAPLLSRLNAIRRRHAAFRELSTIRFHGAEDEQLFVFSKTAADGTDPVLVVVNLDPHNARCGNLHLDLGALGIPADRDLVAHDELSDQTFAWRGPDPWVRLDPALLVAHVISLTAR